VTLVADSGDGDSTPERSGFLPDRIVHLHPTRSCNLACLHCYSDSAPQHNTALDLTSLSAALPILKAEGYTVVSLSGGEPLVYAPLRDIVDCAKAEGFRVTMITNGLLVSERMDEVLSLLDGIAVSFDGLSATHNLMRRRADAFDRASGALARLANKGWPVAAAISVTRNAIPDLPGLADHLVDLGAQALQVRPVARAGRAQTMTTSSFLTEADRARLYLVVLALQQELASRARIHCDLAPAKGLWQQREDYAVLLGTCAKTPERWPLAELVNPLVITETGILKPIAYDFDSRFHIASIETLSRDRLSEYKRQDLRQFQSLIAGALSTLRDVQGLVDWFDYCTRLSELRVNQSVRNRED
jgi:pyruvate-formate lyase-activating enzyme